MFDVWRVDGENGIIVFVEGELPIPDNIKVNWSYPRDGNKMKPKTN